jgi:hypothetical protein
LAVEESTSFSRRMLTPLMALATGARGYNSLFSYFLVGAALILCASKRKVMAMRTRRSDFWHSMERGWDGGGQGGGGGRERRERDADERS